MDGVHSREISLYWLSLTISFSFFLFFIFLSNDFVSSSFFLPLGIVTIKNQVDRETTDKYNLSVTAKDSQRSTVVHVPITILDVNDNNPVFEDKQYAVSVAEDAGQILYASGGKFCCLF